MRQSTPGLWLDDAKRVCGAQPSILVISPGHHAGSSGASLALRAVQDERLLVETDNWLPRIKSAGVHAKDVFHPIDELLIDSWDAPHFFPATA
jgi:hypothetical protein